MLLSKDKVLEFFSKFNIPLNGKKKISDNEYQELADYSKDMGASFLFFLEYYIIADKNLLFCPFLDEENLYDTYCEFMTGWFDFKA